MSEEKKVKIPQLQPNSIEQAEFKRNVWSVTPAEGVKPEDLLVPEYWAHTAVKLMPGDLIEAIPKDRSFYAEFIVIGKDKFWAKIKSLRIVQIFENQEEKAKTDPEYTVKFVNGPQKWRVQRISDKEVMSSGHDSREEASQWLKKHKADLK